MTQLLRILPSPEVTASSETTTSSSPEDVAASDPVVDADILRAFKPSGFTPGEWTPTAGSLPQATDIGVASSCELYERSWKRGDGTQFQLVWAACSEEVVARTAQKDAAARLLESSIAKDWFSESSLPNHADVVTGLVGPGRAGRMWIQDGYRIVLITQCPTLTKISCAALSGDSASNLAGRLPGSPRIDSAPASNVFPASRLSTSDTLVGGFLIAWLLLVGVRKLPQLQPQSYRFDSFHRRQIDVTNQALEIRRAFQNRRAGQVVAAIGIGFSAVALAALFRQAALVPASLIAVGGAVATCGLFAVRSSSRLVHPPELPDANLPGTYVVEDEPGGPGRRLWDSFRRPIGYLVFGLLGLLAVALPLLALAGEVLVRVVSSTRDAGRLLGYGVIFAIVIGYFLDRAARRLRARSIRQSVDDRPPLLYLRSFGDDRQRIGASGLTRKGLWQVLTASLNPVRHSPFEELLTDRLRTHGPVYALNDPHVALATLGATKTSVGRRQDWREVVENYAQGAFAVVVSATPAVLNDGILWELALIAQWLCHGRLVLILGPIEPMAVRSRFAAFINAAADFPSFRPLAEGWVSEGSQVLVHVPAEGIGSWYGFGASRRSSWTYAAAIDEGLAYARVRWQEPSVDLAVLDTADVTETVREAVQDAATKSRTGHPVSTSELLYSLERADVRESWDRIRLHSRDPQAIAGGRLDEPIGAPIKWHGTDFTSSVATGIRTALSISYRHDLMPLPLGVLVLALIGDSRSEASRELGVAQDRAARRDLLTLVQHDLLGVELTGLVVGPTVFVRGRALDHTASTIPEVSPTATAVASGEGRTAISSAASMSLPERPLKPRLSTYLLSAMIVLFFGCGPVSATNGEDSFTVVALAVFGLLFGTFFLWITANTHAGRRYAWIFATMGGVIIGTLDLVALEQIGALG